MYYSGGKTMTWFKDSRGHTIESKNKIHRLLYCPLCKKLISKADCEKLRQSSRTKNLYPVKRYYYYSKTQIESRPGLPEGVTTLSPQIGLSKMVSRVEKT